MKYINDLTYLSHIAQTKKAAKDKKQKNKYRQIELLNDIQCSDEVVEEVLEDFPLIEKENERRDENDRRKVQENRGRYIESRLKKNRRNKKDIFLII